ncbi:YybH family protein [Gaopeijia maritima]|uniref:SgcJ/EcaC family oxidoreductase n=1 Tax=Gaopeijia maritima TaxID=3119007 RepID=A0ABU9EB40_9BACT
MPSIARTPALSALALLAAVLLHAAPADGQALPSAVALPPELDRVLRDYETAWQARDADALADLFTADGFVLRPGRPPAHGREAILAAYAGAGGPLHLIAWDHAIDGSTGWIIGGYAAAPDQPVVGKYVLALARGDDGRWRIAADIDNPNAGGPPPF